MRKTLIDVNLYGIAEDMHTESNWESEYFAALYNQGHKKVRLIAETENGIELDHLQDTIRLKIRRVLGGNQWNVYKNLTAMNAKNTELHLGMTDGKAARKVLYVPGIPGKIDLVNPEGVGDLVWNKNLANTDVFVSSSPHIIGGDAYWAGLRDALARDPSTGIYWNPQTRQIAKDGLAPETLQALKGRVKILQVNEPEAHEMVRNYIHADGNIDRLQNLVHAHWTVVTQAKNGATAYEAGRKIPQPASQHDEAVIRGFLGKDYCEGMEVGCGDMFISVLMMQNTQTIERALMHAALMAKMQYHHSGSNISTVKNFRPAQVTM